ncbi:uncharacterized protein LOC118348408 [Juglans regia]|uniref:Uncharacterized protein LOC118348408 n=1 Tax=Juglans regia TaxID=51240 RepID=A0A6P9ETK7_JUGRE|nr:uncharacterized protein LOC118348408 [Juglans regia]
MEDQTAVALTTKQLWHMRNKWVFESQFLSPQQVTKQVSTSLPELHMLKGVQEKKVSLASSPSQWCKPFFNHYKINWDAAIDKVHCRVGTGVVIRDWNVCVTTTLRSTCASFLDPLLGEAIAALRAVKFCAELGLRTIILEGDSLNVVNAING